MAKRYKGYVINGFEFHTKDCELGSNTQNSGIVVTAKTMSFASSKDRNPVEGNVNYYEKLIDIVGVTYFDQLKFVLFKCEWVDIRAQGRGVKVDDFGFTLVNFNKLLSSEQDLIDEPYVLSSQTEQAFYVQDPIDLDWHEVVQTRPRDLYDMQGEAQIDRDNYYENEPFNRGQVNGRGSYDDVTWVREDVNMEDVSSYDNNVNEGRDFVDSSN